MYNKYVIDRIYITLKDYALLLEHSGSPRYNMIKGGNICGNVRGHICIGVRNTHIIS